jgi:glutamine amidotransferase
MIVMVDYGVGNLRSVEKAIRSVGGEILTTTDPATIQSADKIILPGVGAFQDGMRGLERHDLVEPLRQAAGRHKPLLGICLGMQLLFEVGFEHGEMTGLRLLPGEVVAFPLGDVKIPQTGWNQIWPTNEELLLKGIKPGDYAYFNHSYYCAADQEHILARTEYGLEYASVVGRENVLGVQFHPEKSQRVGLQILRNFVES